MTSPAVQSAHRLRRIAAALAAGQMPAAEDAKWMAQALENYLAAASRGADLEICFGLKPMPGGDPWWTLEAIESRNAAIREMAERFWPDVRPANQADKIHRAALRYAASSWRFDRDRPGMPSEYADTPKECLWQAFASGGKMPLAKRQLETILSVKTPSQECPVQVET